MERWRKADRQSSFPQFAISPFANSLFSRRLSKLLAALDGLLDGANHVERRLGQVIVFAFAQALKAANGVGQFDKNAGRSGEHFGDVERLRQEAFDLPRSRHSELVLLGKLVHAEDGDDVLQRFVALQDLLHAPRYLVVLLADNAGIEHA